MKTLQHKDRIMHEQVPSAVQMTALRDGVLDAAKAYGLQISATVETAKVIERKQQCVKISTNDKRLRELFIAHTSMGTIIYLDMFFAGGVEKLNMAKSIGFGALAGGILGRRGSIVGGLLIPGAIGAHYGKKTAKANAMSEDMLDILLQYVVPHAFQYALGTPGNRIEGDMGQKALASGDGEVVYELPEDDPWEQAERKRQAADEQRKRDLAEQKRKQQAEEAERKRKAAEREHQREQALAEKQRQQAAEEERKRKERKREAEKAEEQRKQAELAAAYVKQERQRQEAEAERKRKEAAIRADRARKAGIEAARKAEANSLNKLVFITREESRGGCVKDIEVEKGRMVTVTIPAGTTYDSHVEIPDAGRLDADTGARGILRLSFAFSD